MERVYNETTSDEVKRDGGYKIGDYGYGGRTYKSTYRVNPNKGNESVTLAFVFYLACALCAVCTYYIEKGYVSAVSTIPEAKAANMYTTPKLNLNFHDTLVFVSSRSSPKAEDSELRDPFFNIDTSHFINENVVRLRRNTEYCQWVEIPHYNKKLVGKDPDYCAKSYGGGSDCENANCNGLSNSRCTSDSCCAWKLGDNIYETETTYTYMKGWRSSRLPSMLYDNPVAYHNPTRDPAPSKDFLSTGTANIGPEYGNDGVHVKVSDITSYLSSWTAVFLTKDITEALSNQALSSGFTEVSHFHIYSRVEQDGFEHPILKAVGAYIVDGIIDIDMIIKGIGLENVLKNNGLDWITKGTCNAGDIRVSFETQSLPTHLTALGHQVAPNLIVSHTYTNKKSLLMLSTTSGITLDDFLEEFKKSAGFYTSIYRFLVMILMFAGSFFIQDSTDIPFFIIGIAANCLNFSVFWYIFYGFPTTITSYLGLAGTILPIIYVLMNSSSSHKYKSH